MNTDGDDMELIATIRSQTVFERWGNIDPRVVLTDERIAHIKEGHEEDYVRFGRNVGEVIETPTYILEDNKNIATALFVKKIEGTNINVVVRLKIEGVGSDDLYSSVITMYRLGDKTLIRLLKRNNVLYKSPEA